ncbi:MAG TPA: creatininase family protein [Gemmatimonadales bacterium]|nr:creatininase family protein [Gemmatimonadales bacterium]
MTRPLYLKHLLPDDFRLALERDARLLVPVGTCEAHGMHLPLGCDTLIVERLADDLSIEFQILRAPTIEYGVNSVYERQYVGNAAVRRKTLHRWMNDLLASWERAGVDTFIILTAHGYDPHQEALSTLRTRAARVLTVDIFALDFAGELAAPEDPAEGNELDTSLLLYVAPELVDMKLARRRAAAATHGAGPEGAGASPEGAPEIGERGAGAAGELFDPALATAEKGARLYKMIYDRIATRVLESAA